jgi:hypothetical protein
VESTQKRENLRQLPEHICKPKVSRHTHCRFNRTLYGNHSVESVTLPASATLKAIWAEITIAAKMDTDKICEETSMGIVR